MGPSLGIGTNKKKNKENKKIKKGKMRQVSCGERRWESGGKLPPLLDQLCGMKKKRK